MFFREPTDSDGKEMYRIVEESKVLDVNSSYSYLLWSKFFSKTSIIATCDDKVIGFVSGFLQPDSPDTLFVWQVAVDSDFRGYGLATTLIQQLIDQVDEKKDVQYLEATVTPSNIPSSKLFQGLAKKNDTDCSIFECFKEEHFPDPDHEAEMTYRIGPLK
ncbi:MAG TPA: diaminobutyrate acetyltransferase [Pseudogracilibacillus sp.]|nr:diaminobutyrate acetyltransferase [Pseudogracilibacillus sp.]